MVVNTGLVLPLNKQYDFIKSLDLVTERKGFQFTITDSLAPWRPRPPYPST